MLLAAEPEGLSLDLDRTAVVVVDMQNAFASPGGMLDLAGIDVRPARDAVARPGRGCAWSGTRRRLRPRGAVGR